MITTIKRWKTLQEISCKRLSTKFYGYKEPIFQLSKIPLFLFIYVNVNLGYRKWWWWLLLLTDSLIFDVSNSSFSDSIPKTGQENDTFSHKEDSRQDTQKVEGSSRQSQI